MPGARYIFDRIFDHAESQPGKVALVHDDVEWTYADFAHRLAGAHAWLEGRAPGSGMAVLCIDSLPESCVWGMALRSRGISTISLSDADGIPAGLGHIACVLTSEGEAQRAAAVMAASSNWLHLPRSGFSGAVGIPGRPVRASFPGSHILGSSGTTGSPRMIRRDPLREAESLPIFADLMGISGQSVAYVRDFPHWTAAGYRWPMIVWNEGGTVVCHQKPDYHRPLLRRQMTHMLATPMTLSRLLQAPELSRNDGMRVLVTGGALSRALAAAVMERLTRQVCLLFATTESAMVGLTPVGGVDDLRWYDIHPSREVQIVDEEDRVLSPGKAGMLRIRTLDGVNAYIGNEEASRAAFRGGWFYSGDLGMLSTEGRLALLGRVTEAINVLGNKIPVGDIERGIQDSLQAEGVCVFSMLGADEGDEVHVAIQPYRPVTQAELERLARAYFSVLPRVRWHIVAELPRNRMGKVRRDVLIEQLRGR